MDKVREVWPCKSYGVIPAERRWTTGKMKAELDARSVTLILITLWSRQGKEEVYDGKVRGGEMSDELERLKRVVQNAYDQLQNDELTKDGAYNLALKWVLEQIEALALE